MNNPGQQQSDNNNNGKNSSSNSNSNSQDHQNPANDNNNSHSNNMYSPTVAANSNGSVGAGQPFGSSNNSTAHFFQQPQQQQQGGDIGAMDDVQFNASLDALLNGDQLSSITGSSTPQASSSGSNSGSANCNSFSTQQQQQQQAMNVAQPYLVSAGAPGTAGGYAPQQQQALTGQAQPGQQQRQVQHLVGLPLASAHQGALQLVPQGPHSAAQMSLSAAHAAVTGAFHPGNPAPMAAPLPQQQQVVQAPFPWAITSNTVTPTTAVAAAPPAPMSVVASAPTMIDSMQHHQQAASISSSKGGRQRKRTHDVSAVSEDEGDRSKRRNDRNLREQQRSHKITEQIAELREVLSSANLQFKPDKYSTLTKVVEYIRQLQERSQLLDVEHKKLIETISETNEIVNNQYVPAYSSGSDSPSISNDLLADGVSSSLEDESMVYVRGLDYKIAFQGCGIPLALSSIDGRFLDCNDTFLALTGYSREELLPLDEPGQKNTVSFSPNQDESSKKNLSLFNLLSRDDMEQVFTAMSEMLKHPGSIGTPETKPTDASRMADFWSGPVKLCHQDNKPVKLNVTLVRTSRGRPKFFNCALTALSADGAYRFDDQTTLTTPSQSLSNTSSQQQQTQDHSKVQASSSKEESAEVPSLSPPKVLSGGQPEVAVSNPGGG